MHLKKGIIDFEPPPNMALQRNEHLRVLQPEPAFPARHVAANCRFAYRVVRVILSYSVPDPVSGVALLAWLVTVGLQDLVYEIAHQIELRSLAHRPFPLGGSAPFSASRTIRRCTLNFLATPTIVPTPCSYSRRTCSNNRTLAPLSNRRLLSGRSPREGYRSDAGGPNQSSENINSALSGDWKHGFMSPLFELTIRLDLECEPNRIQTPCGDFACRLSASKQFTDTRRTGRLERELSQSPPLAGLSTPTGVPTRSETR